MILDAHEDLRANAQVALHENIERMIYGALRGILDWHDAIVRSAPGAGIQDIGDLHLRCVFHARSKTTPGRLVSIRRFRTEVGDDQSLLQGIRCADDLAVDRSNGSIREAAFQLLGFGDQSAKDLFLTLRSIDGSTLGLLDQADLVDKIS